MALAEKINGRRQIETGSRITYIRQYECLKTEITMGAGGWVGQNGVTLPAKGDALDIGTWTNKITPRVYDLQKVPHRTRAKTYILVYYGAPQCQGTASGSLVEHADSQRYWVDYRGRWFGYRKYSCLDADAATHRATLQTTAWTVNSISMRPRDVNVYPDMSCPGTSIIVCRFHFEDNPWQYRTGAATLGILGNGVPYRMLKDVDGKVIEGPSSDAAEAAAGIYYRIVTGSNIILKDRAFIAIKTGYAPANLAWATWNGWYGKTNSAQLTLTNFPTIEIGELKCISVEVPSYEFLDPTTQVVPVIFKFEYRKGGWPTLTVEKVKDEIIKQYVLSPNDDPTSGTRTYIKPDGTDTTTASEAKWRTITRTRRVVQDADAGARTLHNTADFSSIYTLLAW
jgi:hypothetical protein